MASVVDIPERLAKMLIDAHPSIVAAYQYTQGGIDQLERPCWLVFPESQSFQQTTVDQEQVDMGVSLAHIGHIYNSPSDVSLSLEYEQLAREISVSTSQYLLEHPQLQMSNQRGVFDEVLTSLDGVTWMKLDGVSAVTLYSRDAVSGEAFWGFTVDVTVTYQLAYCTTGIR